MIVIEKKVINNVPVIEMVEQDALHKNLPLALFFHGVTNQKEQGLTVGYELAKKGFRTVIPDAYLHGERIDEPYHGPKEMAFWHIEMKTIEELPEIVDYYVSRQLASHNSVTVTGLSMGAIATCMAFAKYPWIKAAGCLMGNPDPVSFTKWLLTSHWRDSIEEMANVDEATIEVAMRPFLSLSLKEAPEKIAGRPFYIWHGKEDATVPFEQMEQFVTAIAEKDYARNVHATFSEGQGHKVPYEIFVAMAEVLTTLK